MLPSACAMGTGTRQGGTCRPGSTWRRARASSLCIPPKQEGRTGDDTEHKMRTAALRHAMLASGRGRWRLRPARPSRVETPRQGTRSAARRLCKGRSRLPSTQMVVGVGIACAVARVAHALAGRNGWGTRRASAHHGMQKCGVQRRRMHVCRCCGDAVGAKKVVHAPEHCGFQ
jgi:hypothetical protein